MKLSTLKKVALTGVFAGVLAGCASATPPDSKKDATALSLSPDKTALQNKTAATPAATTANDLDSALSQAETQRKNGDFAGATHTLSQLVLGSPDNPRVLGEYGKTLVAQGRTDDALAFLERALELQPADWTLYSAQGVAYDQKGDYKAAQASYDHALALKPGEPSVLSNAALSHMQSGDLDGAEKLLLQASPNGAEYPRIANNLELVRNLKAAQAKDAAVAVASAPVPAGLKALPTAPAAIVPASTPTPPPSHLKIDTATLQPPQAVSNQPAQSVSHPAQITPPPSGIAALQADPSVRVQAVPKDNQAGPKNPPKAVAQAKKPDDSKNAQTAMLRPALGDEDKP